MKVSTARASGSLPAGSAKIRFVMSGHRNQTAAARAPAAIRPGNHAIPKIEMMLRNVKRYVSLIVRSTGISTIARPRLPLGGTIQLFSPEQNHLAVIPGEDRSRSERSEVKGTQVESPGTIGIENAPAPRDLFQHLGPLDLAPRCGARRG
jgi:hypothetical protein